VQPQVLVSVIEALLRAAEAEARARQSERDALDILESIGEAVYLLDPDFRFTYANSAAERLLGKSRADLIGKSRAELFPGTLGTTADREFHRAMAERTPAFFETFYDPWKKWFQVDATPVGNGGIAVRLLDITGRKLADEDRRRVFHELAEKSGELETLLEAAPAAVWIAHDPECRTVTGNRMAEAASESAPGENLALGGVRGRRFSLGGKDLKPEDLPIQRAAATGADIRDAEFEVRLPSGRVMYMLGNASPLRDEQGRVRGSVGAFLDISRRKEAEQALAEAVQRLDAHMDNSPLAVVEFDREFRVTRWSKEAEKLFGWSAPEILNRAIAEMPWIHPDDVGAVAELSRGMLQGTHPRNVGVNRNYRKDGGVVECVWYNSAIYDAEGRMTSILSQVLDITERKRTEQRLLQAQKTESIALLAGGVAHDFNNLLVGVIGNASLALELLPESNPAHELLRGIIKSGEQAAHLTRQMLAYSGKGRFVVEPVDLSDVVREVVDIVGATASKKIAMVLEFAPGLPPVESDRGQIHQVLMNLVVNAIEAIGEQTGVIAVRTGVRTVDEISARDLEGWDIRPGTYVFLEVRDTGPGMDEATKAKIFEPFFTTKFQGRGLGLAAVAGIVRGHKGAIHIESSPGKGASFLLFLPAISGRALRAEGPAPVLVRDLNAGGTVLIVDDDEDVRNMVRLSLERRGCKTALASSGMEAIEALTRDPAGISVAILDVGMPGMSGQETLPRLLAVNPRLCVVVSSGYSEADALAPFQGMPIAGYIQKPYTVQALLAKVQAILDRRPARPA
jgi:PAS domain S-box-containing protein